MTKKDKPKKKGRTDKIEDRMEAIEYRVGELYQKIHAIELDQPRINLAAKDNRDATAQALQEAQKARKHAQVNQETLVQHATELGRLRAAETDVKNLIRTERERLDHHDEAINQLHNRICDLEPKDVDPRQCPNQPEPCVARVADGYVDVNRNEVMGVQEALDWQHRTNEAKKRLQAELDAAMAEIKELQGKLDDQRDEMEAQAETIDRLDHVLEDRNAELAALRNQLEKVRREQDREQARGGGRLDQARETIQDLQRQLGKYPDEADMRAILEMLRFMCYDAQETDDEIPDWDEDTHAVVEQAGEMLARYGHWLPPTPCQDDDEPEPQTVKDRVEAAKATIQPRSFLDTEPLVDYDEIEGRAVETAVEHAKRRRMPWAKGINPDPSKQELAAERDVFLNWSENLQREIDAAKAEIERQKATIEQQAQEIARLALREQHAMSDGLFQDKWKAQELMRLQKENSKLANFLGTAALQATSPIEMGTMQVGLPPEIPQTPEAREKKTDERRDQDRPSARPFQAGEPADPGEDADRDGGIAAQREVDLGTAAGEPDRQP